MNIISNSNYILNFIVHISIDGEDELVNLDHLKKILLLLEVML